MTLDDWPMLFILLSWVAALLGLSIWSGNEKAKARCEWEACHGVLSYDCRNWETEND